MATEEDGRSRKRSRLTFDVRYVGYSPVPKIPGGDTRNAVRYRDIVDEVIDRQVSYVERSKKDSIGIAATITFASPEQTVIIAEMTPSAADPGDQKLRLSSEAVVVSFPANNTLAFCTGPHEQKAVGILECKEAAASHKCHVFLLRTNEEANSVGTALMRLLGEAVSLSPAPTSPRRHTISAASAWKPIRRLINSGSLTRSRRKSRYSTSQENFSRIGIRELAASSSLSGSVESNNKLPKKTAEPPSSPTNEEALTPERPFGRASPDVRRDSFRRRQVPRESYFVDDNEPAQQQKNRSLFGDLHHRTLKPPTSKGSVLRRDERNDPLALWPAVSPGKGPKPSAYVVGTPAVLLSLEDGDHTAPPGFVL